MSALAAFNAAEPWVDVQIATRFAGIAHVFHYTISDIYDLEYELWVQLAQAFDAHLEETRKANNRLRR